jgi:hypothetical protein
MKRISERISAAVTGVKCPGCSQFVTPTIKVPDGPSEAEMSAPGKRWSFVWRPPSGEVCPECGFPLARFARRLKWMWTFRVGVISLVLAFLLLLVKRYGSVETALNWPLRVLGLFGSLALVVGVVGLIVGGRHAPEEP